MKMTSEKAYSTSDSQIERNQKSSFKLGYVFAQSMELYKTDEYCYHTDAYCHYFGWSIYYLPSICYIYDRIA